jgi:DNA helicase HerA-like ATPase
MRPVRGHIKRHVPIPIHWIGIVKDWDQRCQSIGEALVSLPIEALTHHALAVGSTGSGKTTFLLHLVAQDLRLGHSFVVFDARGDLNLAIIELIARAGVDPRKVKYFNLREKHQPLGFNPLHGAGEAYFRALDVLDALAAESES